MTTFFMMGCGDLIRTHDTDGKPVCRFHVKSSDKSTLARTVQHTVEKPDPIDPATVDLTGRKAKCASCGSLHNADGTAADGTRIWRGPVPFLTINPDYDGVEKFDTTYDGCRGWD